jgi:hypothetical protein
MTQKLFYETKEYIQKHVRLIIAFITCALFVIALSLGFSALAAAVTNL